jgi:hypothetical protein
MNERNPEPVEQRTSDATEHGSVKRVDPQLVVDGVQALGVLAGGVGTAALGAAKLKEAFGTNDSGPPPPPPEQSPPPDAQAE